MKPITVSSSTQTVPPDNFPTIRVSIALLAVSKISMTSESYNSILNSVSAESAITNKRLRALLRIKELLREFANPNEFLSVPSITCGLRNLTKRIESIKVDNEKHSAFYVNRETLKTIEDFVEKVENLTIEIPKSNISPHCTLMSVL